MLRFVDIMLSNPAKSDVAAIPIKAVVTAEDFGISIGSGLVEKLQLEKIDQREVEAIGAPNNRIVPYVGPVRVSCGNHEIFIGALQCATGVVIGAQAARELNLINQSEIVSATEAAPTKKLSGIMIQEGAVDEETCRKICEYALDKKRRRDGVQVVSNSVMSDAKSYKQKQEHSRDSFDVPIDGIRKLIDQIYYDIITKYIEPFFGVEIEWWEMPQLLSYEKGGRYDPHVDGMRAVKKPGGREAWVRHTDREISLILYLNDEFTGGALRFPQHDIKIQPKPGLLVSFPSTDEYKHGAEPTESGDRLVLVSWSTIVGSARLRDTPGYAVYKNSIKKAA